MNSSNLGYTSSFMVGAMTNKKKIEESLYYSGVDKLDLLIDIDLLLVEAKLTERQKEVVALYFFNQYTQEEVSKVLGISQQAVLDHIKKIKNKITLNILMMADKARNRQTRLPIYHDFYMFYRYSTYSTCQKIEKLKPKWREIIIKLENE